MSLLNRLPCVPAWSTCPRANVPKACQLFIFTCQRANKHANVPKACQFLNSVRTNVPIFHPGVPTSQRAWQFFSFACQKACQIFNYFSKENTFQFFNFSIMLNICKFQEYLCNSRKFISRNKKSP